MKRTSLVVAGFSAMVALGLIGYGCTSGDTVNDGTGGKGSGGQTTSGNGGSTTGTGGSTTSGTGGMTTTGSGGSNTGTGGSNTGTGGATGGGTGGATGGGTGGSSGGVAMCPSSLKDKMVCAATDVSPCNKNCGVNAAGAGLPRATKPCACIASTVTPPMAWDCTNAGACTYPATFDKTCFSLTPVPQACPTTLITTGVSPCTNTAGAMCGPICGSATTTVNSYQDSNMNPKAGYCACISGVWQCASTKEWPTM